MNKFEQLIEYVINDDTQKAQELFHEIVVEKSRQIYEDIMSEEEIDEAEEGEDLEEGDMGGDAADDLIDDVEAEEQDDMNMEAEGDDDMEMDVDGGDDMGGMGGMDDMGDDEGEEDEEEFRMMEAEDDEEEDDDEEEMTESRRPMQKTAVDLMREYVEKISAPSNTEFTPVGTGAGGDKPAGNTKNPLAGKNDMGGTSQNIAKGGNESAPDGQRPNGKAGGFLKGAQEIDVAKRNVNKPGGNKGAQNWYSNKAKAKSGEGQTTDGSVPVQKKSIEPGGN